MRSLMKHDVPVADDCLALQRLYHFERSEPDRVAFIQPMGASHGGDVREITASLHEHLAALNAPLDPHERLDRLIVVSTPWTVESGLLTPTLKIRRHRLEELYRQQLRKWSESTAAIVWESA